MAHGRFVESSFGRGSAVVNYQKIYDRLIVGARKTPFHGYTERHHIVPKCLGGLNVPENLVRLSAREHFVAHLLLAKIHGDKLLHAAWRMSNMKRYGSRQYAWLKAKKSAYMKANNPHRFRLKILMGTDNPMYGKRGVLSPHFGKKHPERGHKISVSLTGHKLSEVTRQRISAACLGKKKRRVG